MNIIIHSFKGWLIHGRIYITILKLNGAPHLYGATNGKLKNTILEIPHGDIIQYVPIDWIECFSYVNSCRIIL